MNYLVAIILSLFSQIAFAQSNDVKFIETQQSVSIDNIKRTYLVHEPLPALPKRNLIYILHGNGGTGNLMKVITNFNQIADKYNAIVVYPDGYDQAWNDGRSTVRVKGIDDVKFFKTLNNKMRIQYDVDKIYVAGLSNGAMMALRLSCEASDAFNGVAAISASMPEDILPRCQPIKPISRLIMVGNKDLIIPYNGGEIQSIGKRGQGGKVIGMKASLEYFKKLDGVTATPIVITEPSMVKTTYSYKDIKLEGYTVEGGGHTWGSSLSLLSEKVAGGLPPNPVNANKIIWEFFTKK